MKIYLNRAPVAGPWGGGNLWVKAIYDNFPKFGMRIVDVSDEPDVVLLAGLGSENGFMSAAEAVQLKAWRISIGKPVKLVLRVNENDARKGTAGVDDFVKAISLHCDHVVFVSKWMMDYYGADDWPVETSYIHIG